MDTVVKWAECIVTNIAASNANIGRNSSRIHRHKEDSDKFLVGKKTEAEIVTVLAETSSCELFDEEWPIAAPPGGELSSNCKSTEHTADHREKCPVEVGKPAEPATIINVMSSIEEMADHSNVYCPGPLASTDGLKIAYDCNCTIAGG